MYFYCITVYVSFLDLTVTMCSVCLFYFRTLLNARIMNSELKGCGISHRLYEGQGALFGAVGWGHCTTSRNVAGSIPDGVSGIFHWHNPFGRTMALGSTQPLTEMGTRNISWGVKAAGAYGWQPYHLHVPTVLKSGSLNLLEPSGPVQACNGIAFCMRDYPVICVCRNWEQTRQTYHNSILTGRDLNCGHSTRSRTTSSTTDFSVSAGWVLKAVGGEEWGTENTVERYF